MASTMRALTLDPEAKTAAVQNVDVPKPARGEILIKVHAVALNPIDMMFVLKPLGNKGRIVGSDFAGTVVADGGGVSVEVGKRVAGFLQGACSTNDRPGAFAEYLICPADLVWEIPSSTSFEEASTISLAALTASQGLFYRMQIPAPFEWKPENPVESRFEKTEPWNFFIYGASTSVGLYAAQLVRQFSKSSGRSIKLIGSAGKANFSLLKSEPYSYDGLVDYRDSNWPQLAMALSGGAGFHYAADCISEGTSVKNVVSLLQSGGKTSITRSRAAGTWDTEGVTSEKEPIYGAVWEGLGVEIQYPFFTIKASAEARRYAVAFYKWLSIGGKLQGNPIRKMPGGLDAIAQDGLVLLGPGAKAQKDRVEAWMKPLSAEKLVYTIV